MKPSEFNLIVVGWALAFTFMAFLNGWILIGIIDLLLSGLNFIVWLSQPRDCKKIMGVDIGYDI